MNAQIFQDSIVAFSNPGWIIAAYLIIILFFVIVLPSFRVIGPTQVGLVMKRFSFKKLEEDNPIAFNGEAGYQADLLMPGWRWKLWILYSVQEIPVGADSRGANRRGACAGGSPTADRRKIGGLQKRIRRISATSARS